MADSPLTFPDSQIVGLVCVPLTSSTILSYPDDILNFTYKFHLYMLHPSSTFIYLHYESAFITSLSPRQQFYLCVGGRISSRRFGYT